MKNNLKQIRKVKGITQKDLAEHLQVSKAMVSMWENNPDEKIPLSRVKQIAHYLKVNEQELYSNELNMEDIEKDAIQERMEVLAEKYAATSEAKSLGLIKEIGQHHKIISKELNLMFDESEKLENAKRFLQAINDIAIEKVFDRNIHPFALNAFLNRLLSLMEEKNPSKLEYLFKVLEYLSLLDEENHFDIEKASLSQYEDELPKFHELMKS